MKKGKSDLGLPEPEKKSQRPPGGKPPGEKQKEAAWYANVEGMSLSPWWNDKVVFEKLVKKKANSTRRGSSKESSPTGESVSDQRKLPQNLDLHAAFFWEVLRRHSESPRLRDAWKLTAERDGFHALDPASGRSIFRNTSGPHAAEALDVFTSSWKMDYVTLLSQDPIPSGWLEGYCSLWREVSLSDAAPLPIPWRFEGASSKVLHGAACVDLVVQLDGPEDIPLEEYFSPFRGKYRSDVASDFGLATFASPVDANGEPLRALEPKELLAASGQLASTLRYVKEEDGRQVLELNSSTPVRAGDIAAEVNLQIRWDHLERQMALVGLKPMLIAFNPSAPIELVEAEFGTALKRRLARKPSKSKSVNLESFKTIQCLDREVGERTIPLERTVRDFINCSQLDLSRILDRLG